MLQVKQVDKLGPCVGWKGQWTDTAECQLLQQTASQSSPPYENIVLNFWNNLILYSRGKSCGYRFPD